MIEVKIEDQEVIAALRELEQKSRDPKPAHEEIGEYLIVATRERFQDQEAPDGTPWAENSPLTEARKGANNPLIGESKSLSRYFSYDATNGSLVFGSPMKYAGVQQFGASQGAFGRSTRGTPLPWGTIPARPFLGLSTKDRDAVLDIVREYLLTP